MCVCLLGMKMWNWSWNCKSGLKHVSSPLSNTENLTPIIYSIFNLQLRDNVLPNDGLCPYVAGILVRKQVRLKNLQIHSEQISGIFVFFFVFVFVFCFWFERQTWIMGSVDPRVRKLYTVVDRLDSVRVRLRKGISLCSNSNQYRIQPEQSLNQKA